MKIPEFKKLLIGILAALGIGSAGLLGANIQPIPISGGGGTFEGGTVPNATTFESTVNFEDTTTFEFGAIFQAPLEWQLAEDNKQNIGGVSEEGIEYTVRENDEFASLVSLTGYENKADGDKIEINNGTFNTEYERRLSDTTVTVTKESGDTSKGHTRKTYNRNEAGNVDNNAILTEEFKANAQIYNEGLEAYEPVETLFGKFIARIKAAFDVPSIVYSFLGYENDTYMDLDDISIRHYKPTFVSRGEMVLTTNLDVPPAEIVVLTLDEDSQIDTMLSHGFSGVSQRVVLIIPPDVTVAHAAGSISNNLEFILDGGADLETTAITVLELQDMGTYWLQTSSIVSTVSVL
jgi:hypothetical protein